MQPAQFRRIAGQWVTGVAVVTAVDASGEPCGMTMSAVTSLSLEPPQFLICVDQNARTLGALTASGSFCINYLAEDQQSLAIAFARPGGERFQSLKYHAGETGLPVLDGVIAHVECKLNAAHPGGDHVIVVGDAVAGAVNGGRPLGYFSGAYRRVGEELGR